MPFFDLTCFDTGQSFGFVAYIRNIMIDVKSKKISRNEE
jgi:hypothetical protein